MELRSSTLSILHKLPQEGVNYNPEYFVKNRQDKRSLALCSLNVNKVSRFLHHLSMN